MSKAMTSFAIDEWTSIVIGSRLGGAQLNVTKEGSIGLFLESDFCILTIAQCEELAEWAAKAAAEARKRGGRGAAGDETD